MGEKGERGEGRKNQKKKPGKNEGLKRIERSIIPRRVCSLVFFCHAENRRRI